MLQPISILFKYLYEYKEVKTVWRILLLCFTRSPWLQHPQFASKNVLLLFPSYYGKFPKYLHKEEEKVNWDQFYFFLSKFSFTWRMQRKRKTVLVLLVSDFHVTVCISFEPAVLLYAYVWLHLCGTMLTWVKHHVDTEICPPISCKSQDQEHSLFIGCSWRSKALESACRVTVYALCFPTQSHQGTMFLTRN